MTEQLATAAVPKKSTSPLAHALETLLQGQPEQASERDPRAMMDQAMDSFFAVCELRGMQLYEAQQEAILELCADNHVILNTPTGSGKSLVATFAHYMAMACGRRSFYTCPIKALVSEKFFALCEDFGAQNVGMLTGDASINRDAPIICCTAEVLANLALQSDAQDEDFVVIMDEFHYFADAARGVAWQLPLIALRRATFLLMSATLGDIGDIRRGIESMAPRRVAHVSSVVRPVPLDFQYAETPLTETLAELFATGRTPAYVVHFSQRDAIESAQAALSTDFLSKVQKAEIKDAVGGFRFDSPFGKHMRRFILHGMGVHHAGLLPKYRLLVEKLAQQGLLRMIMGTDTLGVGINVPIRSVVLTKLCKYDGTGTQILSVRDFKQISGRAGRKGYDEAGSVICQAPEHVIDNLRAARKVGDDAKALRKLVKKKPPPKGYVPWDKTTFERLIDGKPEPLVSRFEVNHHLLLATLRSNKAGYRALINLIGNSFERPRSKTLLRRKSRTLFMALRQAQLIRLQRNRQSGARVIVDEALGDDFSLTHALGLFVLDVLKELDPNSESYALDVLSVIESMLENPQAIISRQVDKLKKEALDAMRAEGVPYEERIEALEQIEHEKPLGDFLYQHFGAWVQQRPWAQGANVRPKSIVRHMVEHCSTFVEYVNSYGLERIEGVLLRYLSQVYRALIKNLPQEFITDGVIDVIAYLRDMLSRVDASLKAEWSAMTDGHVRQRDASGEPHAAIEHEVMDLSPKMLRARIRAQMHQLTRLLAQQDYATASLFIAASRAGDSNTAAVDHKTAPLGDDELFSPDRLQELMLPFFAEHGRLDAHVGTRRPQNTLITELQNDVWQVQHVLIVDDEPSTWALHAEATVGADASTGGLTVALCRIGP